MTAVVAGGLFNAIAFAGAGFLFSKLNHNGYKDEMRRHNKALEELAKAKEKWYESEVEKRNKISRLRQQVRDAADDLKSTNDSLDQLRKAYYELHQHQRTKPVLSDYYRPSKEMEEYQHIAVGALGLGTGVGTAYALKSLA